MRVEELEIHRASDHPCLEEPVQQFASDASPESQVPIVVQDKLDKSCGSRLFSSLGLCVTAAGISVLQTRVKIPTQGASVIKFPTFEA